MDLESKFYQKIAEEIYSCHEAEYIPSIIQNYCENRPEKHNQAYYYTKVVEALLLNKSYVSILKPLPKGREIAAEISGVVAFKNEQSPAWMPYLLLVEKKFYTADLKKEIDNSKLGSKYKELINDHSDNVQVLKRPDPISPEIQTAITIHCNEGDTVTKGDVLANLSYFKLSDIANIYKRQLEIAKRHCDMQIKNLPLKIINTNKEKFDLKKLKLHDIWQGDIETYDFVISKLKEDFKVIGGPFVFEIGGKLKWTDDLQRYRQRWLAGFICACERKGYLLKNNERGECKNGTYYYKSIATLIAILKGTFDISKLDDAAFTTIMNENIDSKFVAEFNKIFIELKSNLKERKIPVKSNTPAEKINKPLTLNFPK